jgi:hypothetical protein
LTSQKNLLVGNCPTEGIMTTYSLLKAGKEWKARKKGTHLDSALAALKALGGKATGKEIADYVEEKRLLAGSEMDTREAVSWILGYAVRLVLLSAK